MKAFLSMDNEFSMGIYTSLEEEESSLGLLCNQEKRLQKINILYKVYIMYSYTYWPLHQQNVSLLSPYFITYTGVL